MSSKRVLETVPEDSIDGIQKFWEPIAAVNSIVSEHLMDAQSQNLGAAQMIEKMRAAFAQFSLITTGQTTYYDCKLPFQPSHTFSVGYVCDTDAGHRFCRLHSLRKCVICGGALTYV